jgi:hypothetical protein
MHVQAPQIMNLNGYSWLIRDLLWAAREGLDEVVLDLSRVEKAYPDGVLPLIATTMRLRWAANMEIEVIPPSADYMRSVFEAVGWSHFLSTRNIDFPDLPPYTRQFTPARPFGTAGELETIRKSIMQVVLAQGRLAEWLPEAIEWSLWEVMENVLNHSQAGLGWVQLSTFSKTRHANIVVVDCGVGIAGSLNERFPSITDQAALKKAVEQGGTRDPLRNAGYGLTGCARIALSNRGEFVVLSGGYRLTVEPGTSPQGDLYRYSREEGFHQGTIVELELRTHRPVDPDRAFPRRPPTLVESLPGAENEYIFKVQEETANVGTRESGRHARNRLLNLRQGDPEGRYVIDFEGISMLSSSFADELVAKVAQEVGKADFFRSFGLRNMNEAVDTIVQTTLWSRLG